MKCGEQPLWFAGKPACKRYALASSTILRSLPLLRSLKKTRFMAGVSSSAGDSWRDTEGVCSVIANGRRYAVERGEAPLK